MAYDAPRTRTSGLEELDPRRLSTDSKMALVRTRLAFERTFMAWVRTAISLITFGFALHKAADYLDANVEHTPGHRLVGPHEFGALMIGVGVLGLAAAMLQRARHGNAMRKLDGTDSNNPIELVVAVSFVLLGLMVMLEILVGRS